MIDRQGRGLIGEGDVQGTLGGGLVVVKHFMCQRQRLESRLRFMPKVGASAHRGKAQANR